MFMRVQMGGFFERFSNAVQSLDVTIQKRASSPRSRLVAYLLLRASTSDWLVTAADRSAESIRGWGSQL